MCCPRAHVSALRSSLEVRRQSYGFRGATPAQSSISKVFWRLLEKGFAVVVGVLLPGCCGADLASNAAHFASKRSSSWGSQAARAVSWLPSGGQVLLLLLLPFWRSIMTLLFGGRPFTPADNGGVEVNPPALPAGPE